MHHYEAFSLGLAKVVEDIDLDDADKMNKIEAQLKKAKKDKQFKELTTGGGQNSPGPYRAKIKFVSGSVRNAIS